MCKKTYLKINSFYLPILNDDVCDYNRDDDCSK